MGCTESNDVRPMQQRKSRSSNRSDPDPSWYTEVKTQNYSNGKYTGHVNSQGLKHGHGAYDWNDGSKYEGEWKNDCMHGKGCYKYRDGREYKGDFREDKFSGQGVYTYDDGTKFEGKFADDKINGHGAFTTDTGQSFKVEWNDMDPQAAYWLGIEMAQQRAREHRQRSQESVQQAARREIPNRRKATQKYSNGTYVGQVDSRGLKNGFGVYNWNDGNRYEGQWKQDCMHGAGKYHYRDGREYMGELRNDCFNGFGVYRYDDGSEFAGQFADDKINGRGEFKTDRGEKFFVEWKDLDPQAAYWLGIELAQQRAAERQASTQQQSRPPPSPYRQPPSQPHAAQQHQASPPIPVQSSHAFSPPAAAGPMPQIPFGYVPTWNCAICAFPNVATAYGCANCGAPRGAVVHPAFARAQAQVLFSEADLPLNDAVEPAPPRRRLSGLMSRAHNQNEQQQQQQQQPELRQPPPPLPPPPLPPQQQSQQQSDPAALVPSTSISSYGEGHTCVICLERKKTHVIVPCGHMCVCATCVKSPKLKKCPLCRGNIAMTLKVYE